MALYDGGFTPFGGGVFGGFLDGYNMCGMHEQQVLFKDCVFSFNGAIISNNLDDYLKKDILSEILGNNFYADLANPALLQIEGYASWSYVIEIDSDVCDNSRKIVKSRTAAVDKIRIDEENQLSEQRNNPLRIGGPF
ncbi:unnamed protein product [Rotaria sordida]|uniref:Uncharacterized protein n=1 Tax=Rotaria sordida TaxID=392033 RepID=A0A815E6Z4_9BILA|nr:unnamed protein product [Rotaria sordida]CAF1578171.1 unnamed protein product [Rotaria sordida]